MSYCDQIQEPHCGVCAGVRGSRGPVLGSPQEPPAPKRPSARGGVLGAAAQECSRHPSRPCWGRIGICTLGIMRDVPGPKQGGRPTAPAVLWGWCPSAPPAQLRAPRCSGGAGPGAWKAPCWVQAELLGTDLLTQSKCKQQQIDLLLFIELKKKNEKKIRQHKAKPKPQDT